MISPKTDQITFEIQEIWWIKLAGPQVSIRQRLKAFDMLHKHQS